MKYFKVVKILPGTVLSHKELEEMAKKDLAYDVAKRVEKEAKVIYDPIFEEIRVTWPAPNEDNKMKVLEWPTP